MNKKRVILLSSIIQVFLAAALFLPAGKITGQAGQSETTLSVFEMIRRYAGMGFSNDALFFTIFSCCIPALNLIFPHCLKKPMNFGIPTCLSAFHALVTACFFSAARIKMVDSVGMTGLHYLMILFMIVALFLYIDGYFMEKQKPE